jgi:uncharacterized protein
MIDPTLYTSQQQHVVHATAAHVAAVLAGDGTGHDWPHIERVRKVALQLADAEGADRYVVELAALLHDIADWKFHGGDEAAGPRAAREHLTKHRVAESVIDHVCEIIARLSFKGAGVETAMPTLEGRCVQDADRLDAIGAIGIARAFAYGGHKGRALHDPAVPPTLHGSFAEYKRNAGPTLNHFYEKLLLLKDRMQTDAGRRWAKARHEVTQRFVEQFLAEWESADRVE